MLSSSFFGRSALGLLALLASSFLITGCMKAQHDPGSGKFSAGFGKLEPTFESINRKIFGPKCVRCHSGGNTPHGIDLSTYEKIVNSSAFPPLIVPGNPKSSSLYQSIVSNSMPKDSQPLSSAEKSMLYKWIKDGALKVPGDDDGGGKEPCEGEDCDKPCDDDEPCDDDGGGDDNDESPCEEDEPCEIEDGEPI